MSITRPMYNATPNGNVEFTEAEYAEYEANLPAVESQYEAHLAKVARADRDEKLAKSDWRASSDLTLSTEWATYRQALRDIPSQAGFPNTITWPTEPEV